MRVGKWVKVARCPHCAKGAPEAQCDGGLQLALFRVEALVVVPLHAEKSNMLPGLAAFLVLGTGENGGTACRARPG